MVGLRSHWKKFILAIFAFFWNGCGESEAIAVYGAPPCDQGDKCNEPEEQENSSSSKNNGQIAKSSSSSKKDNQENFSSSSEGFGQAVALYGVIYDGGDMPIALYGPPCVLNGTNCEEEGIVNCYEVEDEPDVAIKCDDRTTYRDKQTFAGYARTMRESNKNYAANCSTVSELCVDKYDPETQTNSGGCVPDISCPAEPEENE